MTTERTERLTELICDELTKQGLELDALGDCESAVVQNEFVCINVVQLAERIINHVDGKETEATGAEEDKTKEDDADHVETGNSASDQTHQRRA